MPAVETALVIAIWAGAVYPILGRAVSRPLRGFYVAGAVVLTVAQLALVGLHWQIVPAYCGLLLAGWLLWRQRSDQKGKAMAFTADLLGIATLLALWVLPIFGLPAPTGSYTVGTTGPLNWTDASRSLAGEAGAGGRRRELVVQVWYPAPTEWRWGKPARYARFREVSVAHSYESVVRTNSVLDAPLAEGGAPFPVLIFGHRWGGSREQDTFLAEELASRGYVVVALDHSLNAARTLLNDGSVAKSDRANLLSNFEATTAEAIEALWARELAIWVADDEFVLDKLQQENGGWFSGRLDMSRVGAFGHSFGGAASMRLLGLDPRVKCAVNLDGWTFNGMDARTTEPVLFVYEGSGQVRLPETGVEGELDRADNAAVDGSLARYGGLRAYVAGTQHLDFTDQTLKSPVRRLTFTGPIAGRRVREITRGLVVGFFDRNLKFEGRVPEYPEVTMERHLLPPPPDPPKLRTGNRE